MKDVIGIGALNLDSIWKLADAKDFTGIYVGDKQVYPGCELSGLQKDFKEFVGFVGKGMQKGSSAGGSAGNTITALAKMGFDTGFVGRVGAGDDNGSDIKGNNILKSMECAGVDTGHIAKAGHTGVCFSIAVEGGKRALVVFPNTNDELTYSDMDLGYAMDARYIHMCSFVGQKPFDALAELAVLVKKTIDEGGYAPLISFDPGMLYAVRGAEALMPILENTYILFGSEREIELLSGRDNYLDGVRVLRDLEPGPGIAICVRGLNGSYIATKEDGDHKMGSTFIGNPVDDTGSGSVYAAGFLAGLLKGYLIEECGVLAGKVSSQSMTKLGRGKYPDRRSLKRD